MNGRDEHVHPDNDDEVLAFGSTGGGKQVLLPVVALQFMRYRGTSIVPLETASPCAMNAMPNSPPST